MHFISNIHILSPTVAGLQFSLWNFIRYNMIPVHILYVQFIPNTHFLTPPVTAVLSVELCTLQCVWWGGQRSVWGRGSIILHA